MTERWLPVVGHEGAYEVSDFGAVRSLSRTIMSGNKPTQITGRYLSISVIPKGYHQVALYRDGQRQYHKVHRLVLEAFVGPGDGFDARHLNGVPCDNRLVNLAWGTKSENILDQVAHGSHWAARATRCPHGHPYAGENLIIDKKTGRRSCRECGRRASRNFQRRLRAKAGVR